MSGAFDDRPRTAAPPVGLARACFGLGVAALLLTPPTLAPTPLHGARGTTTRRGGSEAPEAPVARLETPRAVFLAALEEFRDAGPRTFEEQLNRFVDRILAGDAGDPREEKQRRRTILVGLGVLFDGGDTLRDVPLVGSMFDGVAREDEKPLRDSICARARIHGRHDAPKHFFLAAALTSRGGPAAAAQASLWKEFEDARRFDADPPVGSGFSYVDLAYDHAGIRFACDLLGWDDPGDLDRPATALRGYLPDFTALELPERIGWQRFQEEYRGTVTEETLDAIHAAIDATLAEEAAGAASGEQDDAQGDG